MAKRKLNKKDAATAAKVAAPIVAKAHPVAGAALGAAGGVLNGEGAKGAVKGAVKSLGKGSASSASEAASAANTASDMKNAADTASEAKDLASDAKDAKDAASEAKDAASDAKDVAESAGDASDSAKEASKDLLEDKDKTGGKDDKDADKGKDDKDNKDKNDSKDPDPLKDEDKNNSKLLDADDDGTKGAFGKKKNQSMGQKMAKNAAVSAGVTVGKHVATLMAIKFLIAKLMAMLAAMAQAVAAAVTGFFTAIWNGIVQAATFIANAFMSLWAISAILAISVAAAPVAVVVGTTYAVVQTAKDNDVIRQVDSDDNNCDEIIANNTTDAGDGSAIDLSELMEANAKLCYSAFKAYGMDDDHIAGLFGNIQSESSFIPSRLESDYTSTCGVSDEVNMNELGPKKKKALYGNATTYTRDTMDYDGVESYWQKMYTSYGGSGIYTDAYYIESPSGRRVHAPGVGLHGFTGGAFQDLMEFADRPENDGRNWWDLDVQLEHLLREPDNGGYMRSLKPYKEMSVPDAGTAAAYVFSSWEYGYSWGTIYSNWAKGDRESQATSWRTKIVNWKAGTDYDEAYGKSIIAKAEVTLSDASTGKGAANAKKECNDQMTFDNSSIAAAASSFAWDSESQSYNNGTTLYQKVNKAVIGDGLYRSCDRVTCSAVRWSGSDDSFPEGAVPNQISYCATSDKWKKVTWSKLSDLQPGDILFNNKAEDKSSAGHIMVYVGKDEIQAKHPTVDGNIVEGSYADQSAHCDKLSDDLTPSTPGYHGGGYTAYRNVKKETDSKYVNAVAGYSFSNVNMTGVFWPTPNCTIITERFGAHRDWDAYSSTHNAVDIGCGSGTEVHAAHSGTVVEAGYNGGWGNTVVIDHGDGNKTRYSHLSSISVSSGSKVSGNQVIAHSGSTGYSTGAHLDFKWTKNDDPIDPLQFYPSLTFTYYD